MYKRQQTASLPWICTRVDNSTNQVLQMYNVSQVPTFFLLDKNCSVVKRNTQITDLDAEVQSLL